MRVGTAAMFRSVAAEPSALPRHVVPLSPFSSVAQTIQGGPLSGTIYMENLQDQDEELVP